MTTPTTTCCACFTTRDLRDLLEIRDRHDRDRAPWYACRPSIPGPRADCVPLASGSAADYAITSHEPPLLPHVEYLAPVPRPVVGPAPAPVQPFRPGRLVIDRAATDNEGPWWSDRAASHRRSTNGRER